MSFLARQENPSYDLFKGNIQQFVPFSTREARKQFRFVPAGEVQKGTEDEDTAAKLAPIFGTAIAQGILDTSILDQGQQKRIRRGYLKGSRPPMALEFAQSYFVPDGDPDSPLATPLNAETYAEFCEAMYNIFLEGKMLGVVSFDQPSYDDIYAVLMSNPKIAIRETKFPIKRGKTLQTTDKPRLGLDQSSFHSPKPGAARMWDPTSLTGLKEDQVTEALAKLNQKRAAEMTAKFPTAFK